LSSEDPVLLIVNSDADDSGKLMANAAVRKRHQRAPVIDNVLPWLLPVDFRTIDCSPSDDVVLMVSGGLTDDAHQFATGLDGRLISFPAVHGKTVMNAAVSGSVALFEIARQLRLHAAPDSLNATNENGIASN